MIFVIRNVHTIHGFRSSKDSIINIKYRGKSESLAVTEAATISTTRNMPNGNQPVDRCFFIIAASQDFVSIGTPIISSNATFMISFEMSDVTFRSFC
mmetsp:Transcript_5416/g.12795  ORF Transcript_5416/g.12795 Transcript_5416/m.12795 type:complete len:97 (+) Transcript_5416:338-628(+)